jgi:PhoH-like ATPase
MNPWMGALHDNLELLTEGYGDDEWENKATVDILRLKIKVKSMTFMRGRTFLKRFVILDEAQNLTAKQTKAVVTRAGPGTKIVCLGNLDQIDTPYLNGISSGLTHAVETFKNWDRSGHVILQRVERSELAEFADGNL